MLDFELVGHALMVLSGALVLLAFVMRRHPKRKRSITF